MTVEEAKQISYIPGLPEKRKCVLTNRDNTTTEVYIVYAPISYCNETIKLTQKYNHNWNNIPKEELANAIQHGITYKDLICVEDNNKDIFEIDPKFLSWNS